MKGDKGHKGDVLPFDGKVSLSEKTLEEGEPCPLSLHLPNLAWERVSPSAQVSALGHRVQACRIGDAWRFVAWGPDQAPDWSYRAFSNGQCPHWAGTAHREHYPVGERIPQRHILLGARSTAAEARALCAG